MRTVQRSVLTALGLIVSFGLMAPAAEAQSIAPSPEQPWAGKLDDLRGTLAKGNHRKTQRQAQRLVQEMVETMGAREGGFHLMASASLYRSLAEAGLGNHDEALWYWNVARALDPRITEADLETFEEPGRLLLERLSGSSDEVLPMGVTPPKVVERVRPVVPSGPGCVNIPKDGTLQVRAVIDASGRVIRPELLEPLPAIGLIWVGLEALKEWRFDPARHEGEPVPVFYQLAMRFR